MNQREKDLEAGYARHNYDNYAYVDSYARGCADGAEYARKEMAEHLRGVHYEYLVGGSTTVCAALEALIERLEAP